MSHSFQDTLDFYEFTPEDTHNMAALELFLKEALPPILTAFYDHMNATPFTKAIIDGSRHSVDGLKNAQTRHWLGICKEGINEAYRARVERIGHAHVQIGLGPIWYCGGYSKIQQHLLEELQAYYGISKGFLGRNSKTPAGMPSYLAAHKTLAKIMILDMALAIETYNTVREGTFHNIFELTENFTSGIQAQVEQSAAAANELSASIDTINKETSDSRRLMTEVNTHAVSANDAVGNLATMMDEISQMVTLIEDVSDQINLLSLNAAIESARAGDAGRGFAVVADEVRKLADKTSESTKSISDKVGHIQTLSKDSSGMLAQIVESVEQTQGRLAGIAASIEEQTIATGEISDGVTSLLNEVHDTGGKIKREIEQAQS